MPPQKSVQLIILLFAELAPKILLEATHTLFGVALLGFVKLLHDLRLFLDLFVDQDLLGLVQNFVVLLYDCFQV